MHFAAVYLNYGRARKRCESFVVYLEKLVTYDYPCLIAWLGVEVALPPIVVSTKGV